MSTTLTPADRDTARALAFAEDAAAARRAKRAKLVHYLGMPFFLTATMALLLLYVRLSDLDSIEARTLTFPLQFQRLQEHLLLTGLSTVLVLALAIPLGIAATRPRVRRYAPLIIGLGNAGQAIPSLGALALLFFLFRSVDALPSTGIVPVTVSLVAYSFLPILRNTMVGLDQVDDAVLEAGRGMGMSNQLVLRRLELPLAVPVIMAGVRTALVLNVGTAALAFLFGGGGLGQTIQAGFQLNRTPVLIFGAVSVAILALLVDYLAGLVEEVMTPRGL